MIEYSQGDSSRDIVKNSQKNSEDALHFIGRIEKSLDNFNLENIMGELGKRGISFSKEETEKVVQSLGITNLKEEKTQEIQKNTNEQEQEQTKDDEGR